MDETVYMDVLNKKDAIIDKLTATLMGICSAYFSETYEAFFERMELAEDILRKYEEMEDE